MFTLLFTFSFFLLILFRYSKDHRARVIWSFWLKFWTYLKYICITSCFLGKTNDIRDPDVIIIRTPFNIYRQPPLIKLRPLIFRARDFCRKWRLNSALRALTNRQVTWKNSKYPKGSPGILQVCLFMFLLKKPNCRTFVRICDSR